MCVCVCVCICVCVCVCLCVRHRISDFLFQPIALIFSFTEVYQYTISIWPLFGLNWQPQQTRASEFSTVHFVVNISATFKPQNSWHCWRHSQLLCLRVVWGHVPLHTVSCTVPGPTIVHTILAQPVITPPPPPRWHATQRDASCLKATIKYRANWN